MLLPSGIIKGLRVHYSSSVTGFYVSSAYLRLFLFNFLFLISLWFFSQNSCKLRLREVNVTEARLTVQLNRTIAEIFLLYFHLNDSVLLCFIKTKTKKNTFWGLWGLQCSPDPPAAILIVFGTSAFYFAKNWYAHIFSALSPAIIIQSRFASFFAIFQGVFSCFSGSTFKI